MKPMTRSPLSLLFAATILGSATPAAAQLELPRPSPSAKVSQMVGLTEIAVEYSSPAVRKRPIWGALVPYDKLWRTGANAATKITFGREVLVGDKTIPAGSYSLHTIPSKAAWTVVLNKDPSAGDRSYKQSEDVARVQVKPQAAPHRERLTFLFNDTTLDSTSLDIEWEKLRVSLPIRAKTDEQAMASIKAMSDGAWRPYNAAARYLLEVKKDYDGGLGLVEKSLAVKEDWFNLWTKAQLLAAKGNKREAYAIAERVNELGGKSEFFFMKEEVEKALKEWKGK